MKSIPSKKSSKALFTLLTLFMFSLLAFSACSWFDSGSDQGTDSATNSNQNQNANYGPLKTPEKIEGLYVGTCKELFADMRKNDKAAPDDELYRAAAVILASDARTEEANECCNNIKDEALKEECKK